MKSTAASFAVSSGTRRKDPSSITRTVIPHDWATRKARARSVCVKRAGRRAWCFPELAGLVSCSNIGCDSARPIGSVQIALEVGFAHPVSEQVFARSAHLAFRPCSRRPCMTSWNRTFALEFLALSGCQSTVKPEQITVGHFASFSLVLARAALMVHTRTQTPPLRATGAHLFLFPWQ